MSKSSKSKSRRSAAKASNARRAPAPASKPAAKASNIETIVRPAAPITPMSTPATQPAKESRGFTITGKKFAWKMDRQKLATVIGWLLILIGGYAAVDLFVQYLDNDYSAAIVNGERIKQADVDKRLNEKYAKSEVLTLIDSTILMQEAKAKNAVATDAEVDTEYNTFKEQFGDDEQFKLLMLQNNTNEAIIREQIRNYLSTKKLLEPEISTTDEELQKYFTDTYSKTAAEGTKFEDVREEVKEQYVNAQLATKQPELMERLKAAASVQNNTESEPSYGLFKKTSDILRRLFNR